MNLLRSIRFLPLFLVQFLGAFNDNVFKNAFVMLMTFKMAKDLGWGTSIAVNLIMVLFLFPSIFLSAIGGQLADRFEKSKLIQWTKIGEIAIMALAAAGFWTLNPWLLMAATFLTGVQIAIFGPLKYGILPSHLKENELVSGSSMIEAATFAAILLGTILGGMALSSLWSISAWLPWTICLLAVAGWAISRWIPQAPPAGEPFPINWNLITAAKSVLKSAKPQIGIWRSMLGLSWFWTIGSIWLAFIPTYVAENLKEDNHTATIFITIFSLGIGLGSLACQRLQKGEISAKFVPLAGLAISFFTLLFVATQALPDNGFSFGSFKGILTCTCLLGIAVASGIFSVPLYTIIQAWSEPAHTSRNIACNNILNGIFMVAGNGLVAILAIIGIGGYTVLTALAIANIAISIYIIKIIPEAVLHTFLKWILKALFHVRINGLENYKAAKSRKVIIANHVSYLDAALLTAFLPELPTFAVNTEVAKKWWMRPLLWFIRVYPVDPTNPMAIKSLTKLVKSGVPVAIFPEGRLTVTGRLMKVYQGPGMMAIHGDADILPIQLDGVQLTRFSYLRNKVKQHWFPEITITILPPVNLQEIPEDARQARSDLSTRLYNLMSEMAFSTSPKRGMLFEALLQAARTHGKDTKILDDHNWAPISYRTLIAQALTIAPQLAPGPFFEENIGIMLPNSKAAVMTLFGIQASGRCAALLNFSLGSKNLLSTCQTAKVRKLWTSEKFIQEAGLQNEVEALLKAGITVCFLEHLKKNLRTKLRFLLAKVLPGILWAKTKKRMEWPPENIPDKPAIILFTSGSSGTPKAVVLSHANLLANVQQLLSQIDINRDDKVFNCLPIFHSFGLTGGTLCPLLGGVPLFMYPSPLHYRIIPEMVYQTNSTILFGTNTFLGGYSKKAHPYDFHSIRYIFAGAEKVRPETKSLWAEVFGVRILEGYGTTECAPALCMNTPMFNEPGTVGRLLPGIQTRLVPMPGIETGGRLLVKGPNIMLGYFLPEAPGVLTPPENGWYDTGDIVEITDKGFVRILGRAKRFAKVGGEMISLSAVEELASATWPKESSAAVSIPHESRGEEIILFTEHPNPSRKELLEKAKELGMPELCVPKSLVEQSIPALGTGKPDYVTLTQTALARQEPA